MSLDNEPKRIESPYLETSKDTEQKDANKSNNFRYQIPSLPFIDKNFSLFSAPIVLFSSLVAYDTTVCLNKLTCADYVDVGKC